MSPDILWGIRYGKACLLHDAGNDRGTVPGYGPVHTQRQLDLFFANALIRQVMKDATRSYLFVPHIVLGFVTSIFYFVAVRATNRFWWKGKVQDA